MACEDVTMLVASEVSSLIRVWLKIVFRKHVTFAPLSSDVVAKNNKGKNKTNRCPISSHLIMSNLHHNMY